MICFVCKTSNDLQRRGKALRLRMVPSINQNTAPFRKSVWVLLEDHHSLRLRLRLRALDQGYRAVSTSGVEDPTNIEQHIAHGSVQAISVPSLADWMLLIDLARYSCRRLTAAIRLHTWNYVLSGRYHKSSDSKMPRYYD